MSQNPQSAIRNPQSSPPLIDFGRTGTALRDVPVFDVHAHLGDFASIKGVGPEAMIEEMDRIGVDLAALSSVDAINGDVRAGNDAVGEVIRAFPDRFIGYCHVTARYPDAMLPELERCFTQSGFKGIKVYQVGTAYDDPLFDPAWAFAREHGAPVLAHTWSGNITGIDQAAQRFPEVAFMMAHSGSGFRYEGYIEAAKRAANLYLDLTYSREHTNMIEHMVGAVGAERVVWGTDANCFSVSQQLGKVLFARIPDGQKRMILYDNAARLFGFTAQGPYATRF